MVFWAISLCLAAIAALTLVRALARDDADDGKDVPHDIRVYRDQLREVDRDLARGVVTEAEAEAIRTEVSRRLLDADKAGKPHEGSGADGRGRPRLASILVALLVVGGGTGLYSLLGQPGYQDLPLDRRIALAEEIRATRPAQADAEATATPAPAQGAEADASYVALIEQLRTAVAERPEDLEGVQLLARHEARLGNFQAAHAAQAQVIALKGGTATAQDFVDHAELLITAAGGYVSPEAEAALAAALLRDPAHHVARYYSGLLAIQTGRPDIGFRLWQRLLADSPEGAPWLPPIQSQIGELAELAGADFFPSALSPGPTSEDVAAAEDMDADAQMAMIEGMVSGLAERLATEGGTPQDWARLIQAYGVLGRTEQARAIWREAQATFPADVVETTILGAAQAAGLAQ